SELCIFLPLSKYGGRREGRVTAAPGALAPERLREGRVTTGTGGYTPAFPARWFTAYFVLFPVNQRLPPSPARCVSIAADLAPAWARQDHTTSPSALRAARPAPSSRPPHPAARVRDDRDTPLWWARDGT